MKVNYTTTTTISPPRLVAWETTRACNLACHHCRAKAVSTPPPGEMDHQAGRNLLEQLATLAPQPMVILSGGEPLMHPNILDLAAYGHSLGLRMLLSTNGTLVDLPTAKAMKKIGIARVSLSLDGPDPASHDNFRGVSGAFAGLIQAAAHFREAGLAFQINTTLTPVNIHQTKALTDMAISLGAVAHHIFLLVPVGRGEEYEANHQALSPMEYEEVLKALAARENKLSIEFKATCAPQYQRIIRQHKNKTQPGSRGCMAGQGFAFVSATGEVRGCGYLDMPAGHLSQNNFREIYNESTLFQSLRDQNNYQGQCRDCSYWTVCGGCRARAKARGNHLGPEPLCPHHHSEANS